MSTADPKRIGCARDVGRFGVFKRPLEVETQSKLSRARARSFHCLHRTDRSKGTRVRNHVGLREVRVVEHVAKRRFKSHPYTLSDGEDLT